MRGIIAGAIRIWLATQEGPQSRAAIKAGIGMVGNKNATRTVDRMLRDGHLVRSDGGYILGRAPAWQKYATPEDRRNAQRIADAARKRAKRAAAGVKPRVRGSQPKKLPAPKPVPGRVFEPSAVAVQSKRDVSADIAEFVAKGGRIEVLTGIQVKPLTYGGHKGLNNESMRRILESA